MKRWILPMSFLLFLAICASATVWVMRWLTPPSPAVAAAPIAAPAAVVRLQAASTLFGARAAPIAQATNYAVKGVVVARRRDDSVAIIAVEGKPPQAVRIGAEVVPGVTVKEVNAQFVVLAEGARERRIEVPEKVSP